MRFVILTVGLLLTSAFYKSNGLSPLDEELRTILAWVLIISAIMDIGEWFANIVKVGNEK